MAVGYAALITVFAVIDRDKNLLVGAAVAAALGALFIVFAAADEGKTLNAIPRALLLGTTLWELSIPRRVNLIVKLNRKRNKCIRKRKRWVLRQQAKTRLRRLIVRPK